MKIVPPLPKRTRDIQRDELFHSLLVVCIGTVLMAAFGGAALFVDGLVSSEPPNLDLSLFAWYVAMVVSTSTFATRHERKRENDELVDRSVVDVVKRSPNKTAEEIEHLLVVYHSLRVSRSRLLLRLADLVGKTKIFVGEGRDDRIIYFPAALRQDVN